MKAGQKEGKCVSSQREQNEVLSTRFLTFAIGTICDIYIYHKISHIYKIKAN